MDRPQPSLNEFLAHFATQLEETPPEEILADKEFRQLAEWSSMQSLILIASFDWEYGVTMTADELKTAKTIGDLHQIVKGKMQ